MKSDHWESAVLQQSQFFSSNLDAHQNQMSSPFVHAPSLYQMTPMKIYFSLGSCLAGEKPISHSESILHIHGDKCQPATLRPTGQAGQKVGEELKRWRGRSDLWVASLWEPHRQTAWTEEWEWDGEKKKWMGGLISHFPLTFREVQVPGMWTD